jgi:hypothetical protein
LVARNIDSSTKAARPTLFEMVKKLMFIRVVENVRDQALISQIILDFNQIQVAERKIFTKCPAIVQKTFQFDGYYSSNIVIL